MRRAFAVLAGSLAIAAHAAGWDAATLFDRLARERPQSATFEEKKFISLLDRPLESSGVLAFTPPDRLEKRTEKPKPERLVVEGDRVRLERGGKVLALGLKETPGVGVLVDSIRRTLAGDLAGLTRDFSVALDGEPSRWRLVLRPLDPAASSLVERVEISGQEARVATVEIFQADGDRSVLRITPRP